MKWLGIVSIFALVACQAVMEYETTTHTIKMSDDTYRVFEHPKRDRIMTTPSVGKAVGQSIGEGLTMGVVKPRTPEQLHEAAARRYLDTTGRANCKITRGYLVIDPQYEFYFTCT